MRERERERKKVSEWEGEIVRGREGEREEEKGERRGA